MGTRSTIAVENDEGMVDVAYCHWDGYAEHNGRILNRSYTTREDAANLIAGGAMSSLEDNVADIKYYDDQTYDTIPSVEAYERLVADGDIGEEYNYIMRKDGVWYVHHDNTKGFQPLAEVLYEIAASASSDT